MAKWTQKFPSEEVKIQKALGTLPQWELTITVPNQWEDPKELPSILNKYIPFYESWSDGVYLCNATIEQLEQFTIEVKRMIDPEYIKRQKAELIDIIPVNKYLSISVNWAVFPKGTNDGIPS